MKINIFNIDCSLSNFFIYLIIFSCTNCNLSTCILCFYFLDDEFPRAKKFHKPSSSNGSHSRVTAETIVLDDDTDILTIKRGNETRFQRMSSKPFLGSAKYTSTPEDRPYVNLTSDDDDVVLVKETKLGSSGNALRNGRNNQNPSFPENLACLKSFKSGESYLKPFTGSMYLKTLQQNGCTGRTKENVRP